MSAAEPFSPPPPKEDSTAWMPIGIGLAVVALVVGAAVFLLRRPDAGGPLSTHPYAVNLQLSDLSLSGSQNYMGGSVSYLEGDLKNAGDRTVTGVMVEATFKNSLGQAVQKETIPLLVVQPSSPYLDYGPVSNAPLAPGQSRHFRLTFEHLSADWNQQAPALRAVSVVTR